MSEGKVSRIASKGEVNQAWRKINKIKKIDIERELKKKKKKKWNSWYMTKILMEVNK